MSPSKTSLSRVESYANIAQSIFTIAAIVAAGFWFWLQREASSKASLDQEVHAFEISPGVVAVETEVKFQNSGKVKINLGSATVKLQMVSDSPYRVGALAALRGEEYWNSERPLRTGRNNQQFHTGALRWPVVRQYAGKIDNRIEPGETDNMTFTFVISCSFGEGDSARNLKNLKVSAEISKPEESENDQAFAWKSSEFIDVSGLCRP